MDYDWGKYLNGRLFIEDSVIINENKVTSIQEFEHRNDFDIKQVIYEEFPGIESGFYFENYWEDSDAGIVQKWRKIRIPNDPAGSMKVAYNQYESAMFGILNMVNILVEQNKCDLAEFFKQNKIIKAIYKAAADIFGYGNCYNEFINNKYTIKRLFEEIGLDSYFVKSGAHYNEDSDAYFSAKNEVLIFYCNIKSGFFIADSYINFETTGNLTYLKMSYVYIHTLFDEYLLKTIQTISKIDPRTMIKYVPSITSQEIIKCRNKSDLINQMINQLIYKLGWESIASKIEFLENCGIQIDKDVKDDLIFISEKRNVIVHNQGIINKDFLKKVNNTKYNEVYKIDDVIHLNIEMLKNDSNLLKDYVHRIHKMICDKYSLLPYE